MATNPLHSTAAMTVAVNRTRLKSVDLSANYDFNGLEKIAQLQKMCDF